MFRGLPCGVLECDEIRSFCYAKQKNLRDEYKRTFGYGTFSKKVENLAHGVALHFMYYNFRRIHRSLRVTAALAAGVTDRL